MLSYSGSGCALFERFLLQLVLLSRINMMQLLAAPAPQHWFQLSSSIISFYQKEKYLKYIHKSSSKKEDKCPNAEYMGLDHLHYVTAKCRTLAAKIMKQRS
jgi:hypothetical protein